MTADPRDLPASLEDSAVNAAVAEEVLGATKFAEPVLVGPVNRLRKMWWKYNGELMHDAPDVCGDSSASDAMEAKLEERGLLERYVEALSDEALCGGWPVSASDLGRLLRAPLGVKARAALTAVRQAEGT